MYEKTLHCQEYFRKFGEKNPIRLDRYLFLQNFQYRPPATITRNFPSLKDRKKTSADSSGTNG